MKQNNYIAISADGYTTEFDNNHDIISEKLYYAITVHIPLDDECAEVEYVDLAVLINSYIANKQ